MNENAERMPLMSPNPLFTIVSAPAAAAIRPPLKIGARTTQDVSVRKDEGYLSPDSQWRRRLDAIKESLVERTCEAAIEACEAGVAGVIDTLVKNATAQANAAAEQTRAQARIEKAELQAEITQCQAVIDRLQADLSLARQQLAAAVAERSKLMATFELVQRALSLKTSGDGEVEDAAFDEVMHPEPLKAGLPSPSVADAPVADAQVAVREAHPEAVANIKRVLEQVQATYALDVKSDRSSVELVDLLTTRLRQARDVIVARSNLSEHDAIALFEQQIDVMLDLMGGTEFGRHLSISAYEATRNG
jgi:hypothetical protein